MFAGMSHNRLAPNEKSRQLNIQNHSAASDLNLSQKLLGDKILAKLSPQHARCLVGRKSATPRRPSYFGATSALGAYLIIALSP